jgi:hypothetical protein
MRPVHAGPSSQTGSTPTARATVSKWSLAVAGHAATLTAVQAPSTGPFAGSVVSVTRPVATSAARVARSSTWTHAKLFSGTARRAPLACLLLLVRSLRRGDPFVPANARRLYLIAAAVGFGGQAVQLLEAWGRSGLVEHPVVAPYLVPDAHLSFMPLLAGLAIAVGAEVFRQGTALREEVECLV